MHLSSVFVVDFLQLFFLFVAVFLFFFIVSIFEKKSDILDCQVLALVDFHVGVPVRDSF